MEIKTLIKDGKLIIEIPEDYLVNAFAMGVTTNATGTVNDKSEMLLHFERQFTRSEDDSLFGRFIDGVCEEAIDDGEAFVDLDEENF